MQFEQQKIKFRLNSIYIKWIRKKEACICLLKCLMRYF